MELKEIGTRRNSLRLSDNIDFSESVFDNNHDSDENEETPLHKSSVRRPSKRDSIRFDAATLEQHDKAAAAGAGANTDIDAQSNAANTVNPASSKHIEWSPENESILVEWCDAAQCYKWLHARAHQTYSYRHAWYTIPAITLSTISGTASFAQSSIPADFQVYAPLIIGTINIFIGILTTIQQYLKISELNESHRVSAISWDKYARNIRIELSKAPDERMDAGPFIKINRQEFDRLMETSPALPQKIIDEFNRTFLGKPGSDARSRYDELKKPDICNVIESAEHARHHWYKDAEKAALEKAAFEKSMQEAMVAAAAKNAENGIATPIPTMDPQAEIDALSRALKQKEAELRRQKERLLEKEREEQEAKLARIQQFEEEEAARKRAEEEVSKRRQAQQKHIDDYVVMFQTMHGRPPLSDEIMANFKEGGDVDKEFLINYLVAGFHVV